MIRWTLSAEINGTSFQGYLGFAAEGFAGAAKGLTFQETVARLKALSGQDPSNGGDGDKVSVEFVGTFNGKAFTIYDYKGDYDLHVGGHGHFSVEDLKAELSAALATVVPVPYQALVTYDVTERHGWP